jgi:hypothetical protein
MKCPKCNSESTYKRQHTDGYSCNDCSHDWEDEQEREEINQHLTKDVEALAGEISKKIEAAFLVYGNTTKPVGNIIDDLTASIIKKVSEHKGEAMESWLTNIIRHNGSETDISKSAKVLKQLLNDRRKK